ncbi:unnamed protein product [Arctia plantaginis]|uniref:THAP-type domain-containing protein n=1 Tax=Arctia plantaginis TaxID=874455 RepID=A0A8S0YQ56_ARCPL|nr:unnamed protein product [Arctia plantaginis]
MVGKICTVCRRCSYNNRHLSFFTYPSDPIRRYEWLEAVDRLDLLQKLNNHKTRGNHRICEIHFEGIYVKRSKLNEGRKCLSKDAFPTRCLAATAMYKKNAIWGNSTNQNTPIGKQIPTPSRYNLRPVKKEKKYIDDDDQDSNIEEIVPYNYKSNRHTEVKTPPSPPYYVDPSLFCESVIKVSQSTQTPHKSILNINYQRKLEYPSEIKRLRAERATSGDETFIETNSQFLSPNLAKLIKWRLSSADSNEQIKLDLFALNLYYSTNLYNLLKDMLSLPSRESLKKFLLPKTTRLKNTLDSEEFSQQLLDDEIQGVENVCNQPLLVHTTDYRELLPEKNAFVYFCKYCYMKCIEEHKCDSFQFYLDESQQQKECVTHLCSVSLDLNVHNCKMTPPDDFTEFLMILENKFKEYFTPDVQINSVGQEILKNLEEYGFGMPCPCFPIDYLKALFVRVRLFYTIRRNNKFLKNRKSVRSLKVFSL